MLKIGFVHEHYPLGGAEKVTSDIGGYLASKGYQLYIFAHEFNKDSLSDKDKANFTFIKVNKDDFFKIKSENTLIAQVNALELDVLIHVGGHLKINRTNIIKNTCCKHIYAHHGVPFWEEKNELQRLERKVENSKSFFRRWKYKYFKIPLFLKQGKRFIFQKYKDIHQYYDAITVLCEAYNRLLSERLGSADKIVTIPNGVLPAPIPYSMEKKKQILYLGRMSYGDKRVDRLVEIWKNIYQDFPDWEFLLVGDGEERQNLELLAKKYQLERIQFLGATTTPYQYYNEASILCMSSQFEGTPLVITEAQQAGVVPIAFNCSAGVEEMLSPSGENGVLVTAFDRAEYEQKLRNLMTNNRLRKEIQQKIIEKSKTYEMSVIGEKWEALFRSVLDA